MPSRRKNERVEDRARFSFQSSTRLDGTAFLLGVSLQRETVESFQITLKLIASISVFKIAHLILKGDYTKTPQTRQWTIANATPKFILLTSQKDIVTISFTVANAFEKGTFV